MILRGIFHKGSGLGNQLHRYVGARCMAQDLGWDFGMVAPELFKGSSFMNLDMGALSPEYHIQELAGKVIPHTTEPVIDGEFQGEKYFIHRLDEVREWLKVEPLDVLDDVCVINFRGGEYKHFPDLYLPKSYWDFAVAHICLKYGTGMRFEVHTDDPEEAKKFFPTFPIIRDIGINWRSIRYAKYLILSNSSFAILPAHLNESVVEVVAPKYWAGHNKGVWQLKDNEYSKFTYL